MPAATTATERRIPHQSTCSPRPRPKLPFKVGEPFNPEQLHKMTGNRLYTPAIVGAQTGINDAEKRLYVAMHRRWSGQKSDGTCFASHGTLAADLGWKAEKTVQRHWPGLQSRGLIVAEWRAGKKVNKYTPLWHQMFEDAWEAISGAQNEPPEWEFERTIVSAQTGPGPDDLSGQAFDLSGQVERFERTTVSANSYDSFKKHSSSSEVCSWVECAIGEKEREEEEGQPEDIQTKNSPIDPARVTVSLIDTEHATQTRTDKNPPETDAELQFARRELHQSRNLDKRLIRKVSPPSELRTAAVLAYFRDRTHFLAWLNEFDRAGKPGIIGTGGDGYGLYISDAKRNAELVWERISGAPPGDGSHRKPTHREQDMVERFLRNEREKAAVGGVL